MFAGVYTLLPIFLSIADCVSVLPVVEGFRVETSGQTATFFWEPNLTYDNYTLVYSVQATAEYYDVVNIPPGDTFDIPKAANTVTISNLVNSGIYVAGIIINYEDLKGTPSVLTFSIGEYVPFLSLYLSSGRVCE